LLAIIMNALIRWLSRLPQSTPADIVLFLVVFDAVVIIQAGDFRNYITAPELRADVTAIFVLLLITDMVFWFISLTIIERAIEQRYDRRASQFTTAPVLPIFASTAITVSAIVFNLLPFTYRG